MDIYSGGGLLAGLSAARNARSFSVSPENPTGAKGRGGMAAPGEGIASAAARDLGQGWKLNPYVRIPPKETVTLLDVAGEGVISHIWLTCSRPWRGGILRFYWDEGETPAVECPVGDFFACGWDEYAPVRSLPVCVNPNNGFNCYWTMPFRKRARVTFENRGEERCILYFQISGSFQAVPEAALYFCAQFRRVNPLPYKQVHTLLAALPARALRRHTYVAWGVNNSGWWGEAKSVLYRRG